jgi:hypothetical protein
MRCRLALTTVDDILKLIGRRDEYDTRVLEDGTLEVDAYPYLISMKQNTPIFHWTVEAVQDSSDRDEGYSSSPTEDIIEFVKGEVPGGQFMDRFVTSALLRIAKAVMSAECNPDDAALALRRLAARILHLGTAESVLLTLHKMELGQLAGKMTKNGWRIQEFKDDSGLPALEYEIGEMYFGKIMLHDVMYDYKFVVHGSPNVTASGTTNDLEAEFKKWSKSDAVDEARENAPDSPDADTLPPDGGQTKRP